MIKFFRRIRQNLISENRFRNYLLYAIGEIILVVIGILIALSINNWNEIRKQRLQEKDYYCKLLEDLNQDVIQIEQHIEANKQRILSSNKLIQLLQQPQPSQAEVILTMRNAVAETTFTFKPSLAAFEDLKSSGNLSLLTDLELKDKLIDYYTSIEGYIDVIDIISDKTIDAFFNPQKDFREIGWQYIPAVFESIDTSIVDIKALETKNYPSDKLKNQLLSDAVLYLGTGARKNEIYQIMASEIKRMQKTLNNKCDTKYD